MLKHRMTKLRTSMIYHLPKADTHDGKCNKDTPDHSSLVQIFCSMTSLGSNKFYGRLNLKVKSMLLISDYQGQLKIALPGSPLVGGGFDSRSQRSYSRAPLAPRFPSDGK